MNTESKMNQNNVLNGTTGKISELSITDRKPIVTYAGDKELFLSLEGTLSAALPNEPAEWKRSFGRAVKSVNVSATFVPFTIEVLPKKGDYRLIDQPMFHTYWTQCSDVDIYKSTIRDDIDKWMRVLMEYKLIDWMIVVVEAYDFKKSTKFMRASSVYDKVKSDYGAKHADRCLSVINPLKSESRSAGSWRGLVVNTRLLLLTAFDRTVIKFEEIIREQREKRNQVGWSFVKYFLLQEELAFVLEMLGVYEEALVQYDELDALFTQFILNSNLGEIPGWLTQFQAPLDSWDGLQLSVGVNITERSKIQKNSVSLLKFRNYLFSRQCAMLIHSNKPSEVAERTLPFLHNTIRELSLLEIPFMKGAIACWVFLSCIEVLEACKDFSETNLVEQYLKFTAGILSYAREKLAELGELCGLMPGQDQTNEQLRLSVQIFSGLGVDFTKPVEKLKKSLSSPQEFCKQYLELSELAMGTYKHIKRFRCARSLGFDLAKFYWCKGDYLNATTFLQSALECYEQDGWRQLAANARLHLAKSYFQLGDMQKYTQMCVSIASTPEIDLAVRVKHFEEILKTLDSSKPDPPWTGSIKDCMVLTVTDIQVDQGTTTVTAKVNILSNLPCEVTCPTVAVSVIHSSSTSEHKDSPRIRRRRTRSQILTGSALFHRLPVNVILEHNQDKSLARASIEVKESSLFRRQDSTHKYKKVKSDFTRSLTAKNVTLSPGMNKVELTSKENIAGAYNIDQFKVLITDRLELFTFPPYQNMPFEVTRIPPTVTLNAQSELLAGLYQTVVLQITSNGYHIPAGSILTLKTSDGLTIQETSCSDSLEENLSLEIPEVKPHSTLNIPLSLYAELPIFKGTNIIEHEVNIHVPWSDNVCTISLMLQPALSAYLRLHTAKMQKFLFVIVSGLSSQVLRVYDPSMTVLNVNGINLHSVNPPNTTLILSNERKVSYMWKLDINQNTNLSAIKAEFTLYYEIFQEEPQAPFLYKCTFDINNFMTLYIVECKVDPIRGSEFCRVSTVCHLTIKVTKISSNQENSLMYEVQAEHNMWVVCGNPSGVLLWDDSNHEQVVTLEVMPLVNGYLPLPTVKLSKYIPANPKPSPIGGSRSDSHRRLEPFNTGQIYNLSKGQQVHVIAGASPQDI